ncbi:MFS transporter [Actinoallomurus acaciae]|uniref:MFS transporter n=1 Tax=Actinoallomurus acaciae TaxID=502577 RepID=A0ABV5YVZ5_9ACTN
MTTPETRRALVPALLLAALAASLAQTIVIAALPTLGRDLDASPTAVTWVLTAFMLSSSVATPIAGRLGDMFGYRRIMLVCLGCFTAGTLVCALGVRSLGLLVAGRALQGVAGGVFPLAFGIVRATLPATRLRGIVALLSAMFGIGGSVGMVVAGPVVDGPGTAWLFWGTLVLAVAALACAVILPAGSPAGAGRVDLPGAALLSGALVCLLLAVSQGRSWGWGSAAVIGLFAGTAALATAFVLVELRTAGPLVDVRLMRRRSPATTNLATLVVGAAMFGVITLIPRFVQTPAAAGYGFGASATQAGLVMVPVALVMLVAGPFAARLGGRVGSQVPLRIGAVCAAVSFVLLAVAHGHLADFYVAGVIIGAGYGLAFASIGNLVIESSPAEQTGVATGVNTIVRTVGGAVGAQIAAAVLAASASGPAPAETGYTTGFAAFAVLAVAALAVAATIRRPV